MGSALVTNARAFFGPLMRRHSQVNWTLADQAIVSGANFFTALIIARFVGVDAFGVFSLAWFVLLFAQALQSALILTPMLSIGPKESQEAEPGEYYAAVLPLQASFAVLSAAAAAIVLTMGGKAIGMGGAGSTLAIPLGVAVATTQLYEFFRRYGFACGRPTIAFRMDAARYGGQIAALLYFFPAGHGSVAGALLIVAMSAILGCAGLLSDFPNLVWRPQYTLEIARTGIVGIIDSSSNTKSFTLVDVNGRPVDCATAVSGVTPTFAVATFAQIDSYLVASATLNFGTIAAARYSDLSLSVPGAAVDSLVQVSVPGNTPAGVLYQAFVATAGTVTVRATNVQGLITVPSGTFTVRVKV
jgi:hypothetical protein